MHAPGGQSKDIPCVFWETQRMYFLQDEATSAETFGRVIKQANSYKNGKHEMWNNRTIRFLG